MTKEDAKKQAQTLLDAGDIADPAIEELFKILIGPELRIDTTLRGWIIITDIEEHETVYWASEHGVSQGKNVPYVSYSWRELADNGWGVRKLTLEDVDCLAIRQWEDWTFDERVEWHKVDEDRYNGADKVVELTLKIAMKRI